MAAQDQYIQLSSLPEGIRQQVLDYIALLMERHEIMPASEDESEAPEEALNRINERQDLDRRRL